jgi:hypothetical protein
MKNIKARNLQTTKQNKHIESKHPKMLWITNRLQFWHFLPITFDLTIHPLEFFFIHPFSGHIHIVENWTHVQVTPHFMCRLTPKEWGIPKC